MTDIETLYVSSVDAQPVTVDGWADILSPDDDAGTYWQAFTVDSDDGEITYLSENGWVSGVITDGALITDDLPDDVEPYMHGAEGPMMNYWYPVDSIDDDDDAQSAAVAIADLPLCVVRVGGTYGLALTGGGMDLSWDICEAYMRTGNLPPVHFADLPSFAGGHGMSADVAAAMMRSLDVVQRQTERRIANLGNLIARMSATHRS